VLDFDTFVGGVGLIPRFVGFGAFGFGVDVGLHIASGVYGIMDITLKNLFQF